MLGLNQKMLGLNLPILEKQNYEKLTKMEDKLKNVYLEFQNVRRKIKRREQRDMLRKF